MRCRPLLSPEQNDHNHITYSTHTQLTQTCLIKMHCAVKTYAATILYLYRVCNRLTRSRIAHRVTFISFYVDDVGLFAVALR